jgi:hypothetical protein
MEQGASHRFVGGVDLNKSNLAREDQIHALGILLEKSLALRDDDQVLLIYDESFLPYLDALIQCVINRDLRGVHALAKEISGSNGRDDHAQTRIDLASKSSSCGHPRIICHT